MYYDLLLQVINSEDLARSFRSYLAPELLDGCNSYACDVCGTKQSAHRRVAIQSVPSLMTISCQRFDIDRKTWQRVKVTSKNEFPLALVRIYLSLSLSLPLSHTLTVCLSVDLTLCRICHNLLKAGERMR
jgi:ubiquitin C-terminal hydrolase